MHPPTPADDYQWPTCTACHHPLWNTELGRYICRPCEQRTATRLHQLPALFLELHGLATLARGPRHPAARTSHSHRTPPIPPRLDVLTLIAPGGAATRLAAIEDAWRAALGWTIAPWRGAPREAVPAHTRFLTDNLLWASSSYPGIADDVDEIRRLHAECKALAQHDPRHGRVQIGPCPTPLETGYCWQPLTASASSRRINCRSCGSRWETLEDWERLRRDQDAARAELAVAAA